MSETPNAEPQDDDATRIAVHVGDFDLRLTDDGLQLLMIATDQNELGVEVGHTIVWSSAATAFLAQTMKVGYQG